MGKRAFRIPEVLTPDEQEALLRQPNCRYPTGQRNHLLIHVILDTGLRLAEAIAVRWSDIDLNTGKLMVRQGKGPRTARYGLERPICGCCASGGSARPRKWEARSSTCLPPWKGSLSRRGMCSRWSSAAP